MGFVYHRITNQIVALKEIRLNSEEGTPFTAIREGGLALYCLWNSFCVR